MVSVENLARSQAVAFLDVDGCLSPLSGAHMGPLPDTWPVWRRLPRLSTGPVFVAPGLITRLGALPLKLVWCSTWEDAVDRVDGLSEQLGWAGMPWLRLPPGSRPWNKRRAIERWLNENGLRPFVWIDDDPRLWSSGRPWVGRLGVPTLLIRPEKRIGLAPHHLEQIERWVAELRASG